MCRQSAKPLFLVVDLALDNWTSSESRYGASQTDSTPLSRMVGREPADRPRGPTGLRHRGPRSIQVSTTTASWMLNGSVLEPGTPEGPSPSCARTATSGAGRVSVAGGTWVRAAEAHLDSSSRCCGSVWWRSTGSGASGCEGCKPFISRSSVLLWTIGGHRHGCLPSADRDIPARGLRKPKRESQI